MAARSRAVAPDLRRVNQSALLRLLFLEGPLDRVRLGQMTGLSSGTVTNFVVSLLEDGLIIEVGREQSEGGRPRILLGVNPEYGAVIGVDIGETGIRVEAVIRPTEPGDPLAFRRVGAKPSVEPSSRKMRDREPPTTRGGGRRAASSSCFWIPMMFWRRTPWPRWLRHSRAAMR